jgi:RHS repeat-associated protein
VRLEGNTSSGYGGGIYVYGTLDLKCSIVAGNHADGLGGGIYVNDSAYATVEYSTIDGNEANYGGGIYGYLSTGERLHVEFSTISRNHAIGSGSAGGGLMISSASSTGTCSAIVTSSTFSTNTANYSGGIRANGSHAHLEMTESTVSLNEGDEAGGLEFTGATAAIYNTIIAENKNADHSANSDVWGWGSLDTASSYNLFGLGGSGGPTDGDAYGNVVLSGTETAGLAPLGNYGGLTETHALLPDSPAIGAGDDELVSGVTYDQRGEGFNRIVGEHVAIGATEAYLSLEEGTLEIYGTPLDDAITVHANSVSIDRVGTFTVDLSTVTQIHVQALAGSDQVSIDSAVDIPVIVDGGDGDDTIIGGSGENTLTGGAGNDIIYGGANADTIHGDDGYDQLYGEDGNDVLYAGAGNDWLYGGIGDDTLHGDYGDNVLDGGDGADAFTGGTGFNKYLTESGDSNQPENDNHAPVINWIGSPTTELFPNSAGTTEVEAGKPFDVFVNAYDPDGDNIFYSVDRVSGPVLTVTDLGGGHLRILPHEPSSGEPEDLTVRYVLLDGPGNSTESSAMTMTVNPSPAAPIVGASVSVITVTPSVSSPYIYPYYNYKFAGVGLTDDPDLQYQYHLAPSATFTFDVSVDTSNGIDPSKVHISRVTGGSGDPYSSDDGGSLSEPEMIDDVLLQAHYTWTVGGGDKGSYDVVFKTTYDDNPGYVDYRFVYLVVDYLSEQDGHYGYVNALNQKYQDPIGESTYHTGEDEITVTPDANVINSSLWTFFSVADHYEIESAPSGFNLLDADTGEYQFTWDGIATGPFVITWKAIFDGSDNETTTNVASLVITPQDSIAVSPSGQTTEQDKPSPGCSCSCGCPNEVSQNVNQSSGKAYASIPNALSGVGPGAGNFSAPPNQTTVRADLSLPDGVSSANASALRLDPYGDTDQRVSLPISNGDMTTGDEETLYVPLAGLDLPSGYHNIRFSAGSAESNYLYTDQWMPVFQQEDIGFGQGWNLAGTERLLINPDPDAIGTSPIYWLCSDGYIYTFDGLNSRAQGDLSASVLTRLTEPDDYGAAGDYVLTDKYGNKSYFDGDVSSYVTPIRGDTHNSLGTLTHRVDAVGNVIDYSYIDANGDGFDYEPSVIDNNFDGSSTVFDYGSATRVQQIFEYAPDGMSRRTINLTYDSQGHLSTIALPDTDLGNSTDTDRPTLQFEQDSFGRLTSVTDAEGETTTYDYDDQNAIVTTTTHDDAHTTLVVPMISPYQIGVWQTNVGGNNGTGTPSAATLYSTGDLLDPAMLPLRQGRFIDELGRVTTFDVNDSGYIVDLTDPAGHVTDYERTADGLITEETVYASEGGTMLDQTSYTYSTDGKLNLLEADYFDGTDESWTYDSTHSLPTSYSDRLGHETLYTVTGAQTTQVRQVIGAMDSTANGEHDDLVTSFGYTSDGLLHTVTQKDYDPITDTSHDVVTQYDYTSSERWLVTITYAVESSVETFVTVQAFDAFGDPTQVAQKVTGSSNRVTNYTYDDAGELIRIVMPDPDGSDPLLHPAIEYQYTPGGMVKLVTQTSIEDPTAESLTYGDSIVTHNVYDGHHLQSVIQDEGGTDEITTVEYSYDAAHNVTAITTPIGTTNYLYDTLGQLIRITQADPDGEGSLAAPVTYLAYNALGQVLGMVDPKADVRRQEYDDSSHQPTKTVAPLGATTSTKYNAMGELVSSTDAEGRTTTYTYDAAGRLTHIRLPVQSATPIVYTYDTLGNLRTTTDQLGHTTENQYDDLQQLVTQIDGDANATNYTYFADGQIHTLEDAAGNTTTWAYDAAGRVYTETNATSDTQTYTYDEFNRLVKLVDRDGRVDTYDYDNLGHLTHEKWFASVAAYDDGAGTTSETIHYGYNSENQLLEEASDSAATDEFGYDGLGRVTSISQAITGLPPTITLNQQYDANGNRTQVAALFDTTQDFVTNYAFDALGRVSQITQAGDGGNSVSQKRVDFGYNRDGQFQSIKRYADLSGTQLVAQSAYSYDAMGRLNGLIHSKGATTFANYGWTYDAASRVSSVANSLHTAENATYSYDDASELTSVDYTGGGTDEAYTYGAGNRSNVHNATGEIDYESYLNANRYQWDSTYAYGYDGEGNLIGKIDYLGNFDYTLYTWDNRNRLVEVKEYGDGNPYDLGSHTLLKDISYHYDAFNRLVYREIVGSGVKSAFVYDGTQVALEFDKAGSGDLAASDLSHRYLWGPAVDQLLADEQVHGLTSAANNDTLWALADNLGSVRDVVDSDGHLRIHRSFDTFGIVVDEIHKSASGTTVTAGQSGYVDEAFEFTGRWFDKDTGEQYNLNRWYDSYTGRWMSEDPIGFAAGDANLYRYVGNGPTNFIDPHGMAIMLPPGVEPYPKPPEYPPIQFPIPKRDPILFIDPGPPGGPQLVWSAGGIGVEEPAYYRVPQPLIRNLNDCEKAALRRYFSQRDLDNAILHIGTMPWYAPGWARAITIGHDIYIRSPSNKLCNPAGISGLAHELVHVVQWRTGMDVIAYGFYWAYYGGYDNIPYEREACEVEDKVLHDLINQ